LEIYFNSQYTFGLIVFCFLVAGIFSFILYRKAKKDAILSSGQILFLGFLRFLSVFLITALLLQLAIQRIKHSKQKPDLIIGVDNSESLKKFQPEVLALVEQLKNGLKNHEPEILLFDTQTQQSEDLTFNGKRSNYSGFFDGLSQNYLPGNIGAVLLLGDGLFNAGADPVFASGSLSYPIYTVGIGDTTVHTDAAIRNVAVNKTAYLENNFPVEIDLSFIKAAGKLVNLTVSQDNDQVVFSKAITVRSDDYFVTESLSLKPPKEGILKYIVSIDEVGGEQNLANNIHEFSINVISEKQKILIIAHGAHPDLAAIVAALKDQHNYETEILTSFKEGIDFMDYGLVIVHQLPDENQQYLPLLEKLKQSRRPYLFVLGSKTSVARFNNLQTGMQIQSNNILEHAKARINEQFSLFRLEQNEMQALQNLPPLLVPFGDIVTDGMSDIFAFQTIQSVNMERPLIAFGKVEGQKRGFILGEGIWRWRIHTYLKERSHRLFDEFIRKSVNYLILKQNEDNFNVFFQTGYAEDAPVMMQAELFNDSFEPDNSPDVQIDIENGSGQKYHAIFDKVNNGYQLDMGQLPVGEYSFTASTQLGETEYSETGNFSINKIQIEMVKTEADFQVLNQIANKTGGKFFLAKDVEKLIERLKQEAKLLPKQLELQVYKELLSMKWLFFLVLFLLALEWFLRKFWGIY
jgi:hypothetical protein